MNRDFLLDSELSKKLYWDAVNKLPIIDYHNHLPVKELLQNRRYSDITELWIANDPYKHRAMRICGVDEAYITGNASNKEKFMAWSRILPKLAGNPLYHWAEMELHQIFGMEKMLCADNGEDAWGYLNDRLKEPQFSAQGILDYFHVEYAAPCCGISDDISGLKEEKRLAPSFRGDGVIPVCGTFLRELGRVCDHKIEQLQDLEVILENRLGQFHQSGCRFADHALDAGFRYVTDDGKNEIRLQQISQGQSLSQMDMDALNSEVLRILCKIYTGKGWVMQLHIGALRNTSERLRKIAGPAGGYAGIGRPDIENLVVLLKDLENHGILPRTILFTLNPAMNEEISVLSGSFVESGKPGKVQQGTAWWWCDHIRGIRQVLETVSAYSVLSTFYGMTTDSRSLLSFIRHDYFRRILCGWIGDKVRKKELPNDLDLMKRIATDICYGNIKKVLYEEERHG